MSLKTLHSFPVTIDRETEETTTREENGQRISVTSKVVKPQVYTIILKEPSRAEKQALSLFQTITYNKAIELGLLPKARMQKLLSQNVESALSEEEDKSIASINIRLADLSAEYDRLKPLPDKTLTEDQIQRRKEVLSEYLVLTKKVEDLNGAYQSVYAHTAESHMQTKILTWLSLFLTYIRDPNQPTDSAPRPLFPGADFAAREGVLNDLEDSSDPVFVKTVEKLPSFWMLYLFGRASKPEDFLRIEEEWTKEIKMREEAERKVAEEKVKLKVVDAEAVLNVPAPEGEATVVPSDSVIIP